MTRTVEVAEPMDDLEQLMAFYNDSSSSCCFPEPVSVSLARRSPLSFRLCLQSDKYEEEQRFCFNQKESSTAGLGKCLVCHDFRGNYNEDRFNLGIRGLKEESYRFLNWTAIDVMVYFSHHFITIPPQGWISAAHRHGVPVLGTFITESTKAQSIFQDQHQVLLMASACCLVANRFGFDGWLINIENDLAEKQVPLLLQFLTSLRQQLKSANPQSLVIWYDAVTESGKLDYQRELNERNQVFFDACDAIYLDYAWTQDSLSRSSARAGPGREADVYAGIDVFGRGKLMYGSGFQSCEALPFIDQANLSVAIFAPGWTYEDMQITSQQPRPFPFRDYAFWQAYSPLLSVHALRIDTRLSSSFCPGYGRDADGFWLDLNQLDLQPVLLAEPGNMTWPFCIYQKRDFASCSAISSSYGLVLERNEALPKPWSFWNVAMIFPLLVFDWPIAAGKALVVRLQVSRLVRAFVKTSALDDLVELSLLQWDQPSCSFRLPNRTSDQMTVTFVGVQLVPDAGDLPEQASRCDLTHLEMVLED